MAARSLTQTKTMREVEKVTKSPHTCLLFQIVTPAPDIFKTLAMRIPLSIRQDSSRTSTWPAAAATCVAISPKLPPSELLLMTRPEDVQIRRIFARSSQAVANAVVLADATKIMKNWYIVYIYIGIYSRVYMIRIQVWNSPKYQSITVRSRSVTI